MPDESLINESWWEISDSVVFFGSVDDRPEVGWKEEIIKNTKSEFLQILYLLVLIVEYNDRYEHSYN